MASFPAFNVEEIIVPCIPKHLVNEFMNRIKSGEISPEKLSDMTSAERNKYFASFLGEQNAAFVNASFEEKVLLQARKNAAVTWARTVTGITDHARRDIVSRIEKLGTVMTPESHDAFLADLVARKMGMGVTLQEAANLSALAKDVVDAGKKVDEQGADRHTLGAAQYEFNAYYSGLRDKARSKALVDYIKPNNWWEGVQIIGGLAKSLKASLDNSVIGRQGLPTLMSHPEIWLKNSAQSFVDFVSVLGGKDQMKAVASDVLSRPNARNGLYRKEGLAVGVIEESYPTSIPERIPVLGRVFKASQDTFTAWQYRTRADVFDKMVEMAAVHKQDTTGIGKLANSLTGRGELGGLEPQAKVLNNLFFSPRYLRANFDVLTAHAFDGKMGKFAKQQAAWNLLRTAGGIALLLAIAKALDPDSVEEDPRSSDFGKIRIGNTRFNVSGGLAGMATLGARILTSSTKNSTTDIITKLNEQRFGARTVGDIVLEFFGGKASPAAGIIRDYMTGQDFKGNPPTVVGEMVNLFMPIPITNFQELQNDPDSAPALLAMIADAFGIGTNTYSQDVDWTSKTGKEMLQFRDKVGDDKFKEANEMYNDNYKEWFNSVRDGRDYADMDDEEKREFLQGNKEKIKNRVFKKFNFRYKKEK